MLYLFPINNNNKGRRMGIDYSKLYSCLLTAVRQYRLDYFPKDRKKYTWFHAKEGDCRSRKLKKCLKKFSIPTDNIELRILTYALLSNPSGKTLLRDYVFNVVKENLDETVLAAEVKRVCQCRSRAAVSAQVKIIFSKFDLELTAMQNLIATDLAKMFVKGECLQTEVKRIIKELNNKKMTPLCIKSSDFLKERPLMPMKSATKVSR